MSNTWKHYCHNNNVFTILPLEESCKICGVSNAVQSLRYHGYSPKTLTQTQERPLRQLAALFRSKKTDEQQHDYLDRAG
jgi:hypothetical protein